VLLIFATLIDGTYDTYGILMDRGRRKHRSAGKEGERGRNGKWAGAGYGVTRRHVRCLPVGWRWGEVGNKE